MAEEPRPVDADQGRAMTDLDTAVYELIAERPGWEWQSLFIRCQEANRPRQLTRSIRRLELAGRIEYRDGWRVKGGE